MQKCVKSLHSWRPETPLLGPQFQQKGTTRHSTFQRLASGSNFTPSPRCDFSIADLSRAASHPLQCLPCLRIPNETGRRRLSCIKYPTVPSVFFPSLSLSFFPVVVFDVVLLQSTPSHSTNRIENLPQPLTLHQIKIETN